MALIQWDDSFALGIPDVDHEHKALIDLINSLHGALGAASTRDQVADFLAEIHATVAAHFALEEKVMRECEYDQFAAHKADHERLLDDIRNIMDECQQQDHSAVERTLSDRLRVWFERHFSTADRRLHEMLPRGFASRPAT